VSGQGPTAIEDAQRVLARAALWLTPRRRQDLEAVAEPVEAAVAQAIGVTTHDLRRAEAAIDAARRSSGDVSALGAGPAVRNINVK